METVGALGIGSVMVFFVLIGLLVRRSVNTSNTSAVLRKTIAEHGLTVKDGLFAGQADQIALDPEKNVVALARGNIGKVYPVSQITQHSIEWQQKGNLVHYCLVLSVNDFDFPIWKIHQINHKGALDRIAGKINVMWRQNKIAQVSSI